MRDSGTTRSVDPIAVGVRLSRVVLRSCAHLLCLLALLAPPVVAATALGGSVASLAEEAEHEFLRHGAAVPFATAGRGLAAPASKSHLARQIRRARADSLNGLQAVCGHRLANGLSAPLRC